VGPKWPGANLDPPVLAPLARSTAGDAQLLPVSLLLAASSHPLEGERNWLPNALLLYGFAEPKVVKSGAHGGWPLTENCLSFRKLMVSLIIDALSRKSVFFGLSFIFGC